MPRDARRTELQRDCIRVNPRVSAFHFPGGRVSLDPARPVLLGSGWQVRMTLRRSILFVLVAAALAVLAVSAAQRPDPLAEPFKGITGDGTIRSGLFPIRATGVSTKPVADAAAQFLAALTPEQRTISTFPVDDIEWRRWNNVHRAQRSGVAFKDMTDEQQTRAFGLLRASLSATGLEKTRNIMRLNQTIAELTKRFEEYGEGLYHLVVMGEPSQAEPWGWQLEGHHLIINYFVLGDQVAMTPTFMGSEPVIAESGKYAGTKVLQEEQAKGLALMEALSPEQRKTATLEPEKTANNALTQAFRDNQVVPYAGLRASELNDRQKALLLEVIEEYVSNMDEGHAKLRIEEIRKHLPDTYFAWIGAADAESVFYYRVHSPVILIEFDHQLPVALHGPRVPGRQHIHTVVRTPNGNDYGKDLLRQHYETHKHDPAHGHALQPGR